MQEQMGHPAAYLSDAGPSVAIAGLLLLLFAQLLPLLLSHVVFLRQVDDEDRHQTLLLPVSNVSAGVAAYKDEFSISEYVSVKSCSSKLMKE